MQRHLSCTWHQRIAVQYHKNWPAYYWATIIFWLLESYEQSPLMNSAFTRAVMRTQAHGKALDVQRNSYEKEDCRATEKAFSLSGGHRGTRQKSSSSTLSRYPITHVATTFFCEFLACVGVLDLLPPSRSGLRPDTGLWVQSL